MKTFKNVWIIIFPVLVFACITTHLTRHVTIRETYDFFVETYTTELSDFLDDLKRTTQTLKDLSFELPDIETLPDTFIEKIYTYIKWFGKCVLNITIYITAPLQYSMNIVVFIGNTLINFIRVLRFFIGFN